MVWLRESFCGFAHNKLNERKREKNSLQSFHSSSCCYHRLLSYGHTQEDVKEKMKNQYFKEEGGRLFCGFGFINNLREQLSLDRRWCDNFWAQIHDTEEKIMTNFFTLNHGTVLWYGCHKRVEGIKVEEDFPKWWMPSQKRERELWEQQTRRDLKTSRRKLFFYLFSHSPLTTYTQWFIYLLWVANERRDKEQKVCFLLISCLNFFVLCIFYLLIGGWAGECKRDVESDVN